MRFLRTPIAQRCVGQRRPNGRAPVANRALGQHADDNRTALYAGMTKSQTGLRLTGTHSNGVDQLLTYKFAKWSQFAD
jgi:hypothetical protein